MQQVEQLLAVINCHTVQHLMVCNNEGAHLADALGDGLEHIARAEEHRLLRYISDLHIQATPCHSLV